MPHSASSSNGHQSKPKQPPVPATQARSASDQRCITSLDFGKYTEASRLITSKATLLRSASVRRRPRAGLAAAAAARPPPQPPGRSRTATCPAHTCKPAGACVTRGRLGEPATPGPISCQVAEQERQRRCNISAAAMHGHFTLLSSHYRHKSMGRTCPACAQTMHQCAQATRLRPPARRAHRLSPRPPCRRKHAHIRLSAHGAPLKKWSSISNSPPVSLMAEYGKEPKKGSAPAWLWQAYSVKRALQCALHFLPLTSTARLGTAGLYAVEV